MTVPAALRPDSSAAASTDRPLASTDRPLASTDRPFASADAAGHDRTFATYDAAGHDRTLATYAVAGRGRTVCVEVAGDGSLLVVDRRSHDFADARLVARIDREEPPVNAQIVCDHYLANPRACRPLTATDLGTDSADAETADLHGVDIEAPLAGRDGARFRLALCTGEPAELRWIRDRDDERPVSIRCVVGAVEDYEPARTLSLAAVARHRRTAGVAITTLGTELRRLGGSRIVLNRLLREAVLEAIRAQELSMSAIALRCGRVKRGGGGNVSGETSWLARRIGLSPGGGEAAPTPWIHSDVLALIARRGLGIDPREVELG
jgi:hypothetical protein